MRATMSALSLIHWAEDIHLFILGRFQSRPRILGAALSRRRWHQWPRLHLTGMGVSYVLLLTAFYVGNGKNLPLWRELPEIAFWLLLAAAGILADHLRACSAPRYFGL
jgi:hypothetical protein